MVQRNEETMSTHDQHTTGRILLVTDFPLSLLMSYAHHLCPI